MTGRYNFTLASTLSDAYAFSYISPKCKQLTLQTAYALFKRGDVYLQCANQPMNGAGDSSAAADINELADSLPNSYLDCCDHWPASRS